MRPRERRACVKYNAFTAPLRPLRVDVTECAESRAAIANEVLMGDFTEDAATRNRISSMGSEEVASLL